MPYRFRVFEALCHQTSPIHHWQFETKSLTIVADCSGADKNFRFQLHGCSIDCLHYLHNCHLTTILQIFCTVEMFRKTCTIRLVAVHNVNDEEMGLTLAVTPTLLFLISAFTCHMLDQLLRVSVAWSQFFVYDLSPISSMKRICGFQHKTSVESVDLWSPASADRKTSQVDHTCCSMNEFHPIGFLCHLQVWIPVLWD